MSNRVTIVATKFVNLDEEDSPHAISYGFRAFDEYERVYSNTMTEADVRQSDLDLLRQIVAEHPDDILTDMFEFVVMSKAGIEINGCHYEWEQIQPILED